jgi:transcriptional regulator with XRE-family HTH domain
MPFHSVAAFSGPGKAGAPRPSEDHIMDRPGEKLKRARERLKLTYREVEAASQQIAIRRGSDEFAIALSRLADIENKGTLPTIYRLYALCAIYRLELNEVLGWYGVPVDQMAGDALFIRLDQTHAIHFGARDTLTAPQPAGLQIDLDQTTFLSHLIRRWGKQALSFVNGLDLRQYRYGIIGYKDLSMYPLLPPGAIVLIDDARRKIAASGWSNEFDRPIYFLECRGGYLCGWCSLSDHRLLVQTHPASPQKPQWFEYPSEVDVIGQVIGVAKLLGPEALLHARDAGYPAGSPNP